MKTKFLLIATCLALFISAPLFACGGGGCGSYNYSDDDSYESTCGQNFWTDAKSTCSCADPACSENNPCMSRGVCCEAFGNIGAT